MTEQQTCEVGRGSNRPCPHPAAQRIWGDGGPWVCEGHKLVLELGEDEDDLRSSLGYLKRWIRTADHYNVEHLRRALRGVRDELGCELESLEAKERGIGERYSLPPEASARPR